MRITFLVIFALSVIIPIGIPAESVPKWVVNLATWVSEDKITTGDMIIAIEHLINNQSLISISECLKFFIGYLFYDVIF